MGDLIFGGIEGGGTNFVCAIGNEQGGAIPKHINDFIVSPGLGTSAGIKSVMALAQQVFWDRKYEK
jgi:hypothetical protein